MIDMNIFSNVIEEDLDAFDVEQSVEIMLKLNHKWYVGNTMEEIDLDNPENYETPTPTDVYKYLRKRLIENYERMVNEGIDYTYTSSGGFRLESHHSEEDGYWSAIMYCPVESIL